jgi:MFS family permease
VLPLWRNREFVLLQSGQLLSAAGSASSGIAYPLLVLALTHSPAKAGLVSFARLLPHVLLGLVGGLAADRWNRRRLMIAADAVRLLALGSLAGMLLSGEVAFWPIPIVAFVEGTGFVFFGAAEPGATRAVVPRRQLPAAVGAQRARQASVVLSGPPLGGALFELGRAVPFVADAVSYALSTASLLAMRAPFQEERSVESARLRERLAEGFRFLWGHAFLRTCAFLYGIGNFSLPGVLLVIVVVGRREGLTGGEIGVLMAVFGAFLLLGALLSPLFRRSFSVRTIILIELWTWLGCGLYLVWPSVYVLTVGILPQAVAMPVTDSVVVGYRIAVTPDRLLGRVESVRSTISRLVQPLGPLVAGLLLSAVSARQTIAVFAALGLGLALWGTLSPAIRNAPSLEELDLPAAPGRA